jgi:hypothetical protein
MRCGKCWRDTPSVQQREPPFCPSQLCDVCYEYEKTWRASTLESVSKDSTEFFRLYDRLSELRAKIDGFFREAREESEKKAGPWITKKPEWAWDDRF